MPLTPQDAPGATNVMRKCAYCKQPASGDYGIHRDGFGVGPIVDLCNRCGSKSTPSAGRIWDRIARPSSHTFAHIRRGHDLRAESTRSDERERTHAGHAPGTRTAPERP